MSAEIDTVLHKRLGVRAKPQPFQPFANITLVARSEDLNDSGLID